MKRQIIVLSGTKKFIVVWMLLALALPSFSSVAQDGPDLLIWADSTRAPALQGLVEQFSAEFGIETVVQEIAMGDIRSNLPVAGAAGEGPDLVIGAHDWLGEYIQNGAIVPIELGDKAELFAPSALDLFTVDGELYGMPYAVENLAFIRNTDLVPEAPTTWAEVFEVTETIVTDGTAEFGFIIQSNANYDFQPVMSSFGGYVFGTDESGAYNPGDIGIGNEGTIAAAQYIRDYADAGYITADIDGDVMLSLFQTGDAAMILTGPWALNGLRTSGIPFAISDIPTGPAGASQPYIGGQGFMVSAFSDNQLLAQAFLTEFMASADAMLTMYEVDPRPPAFLPTLDALDDDAMVAFQQAGVSGIPLPAIPEMASVWGSWGNAMQFVISGELSPEEAYSQAASQIVELIGELDALPESVTLVGTVQAALGCPGDWQPDCEATFMDDNGDGTYSLTTTALAAGDYEMKVALNGTWDRNYGANGAAGGDNIPFSVAADGDLIVFVYDNSNTTVTVAPGSIALVGTVQAALGCPGDWQPDCAATELSSNGDGTYSLSTTDLAAGDYEVKVAVDDAWTINYGMGGALNGDNIAFNVPADNADVTFSFDGTTQELTIEVGS